MKKQDHPLEYPGMHKGASPPLFDNARKLRGRMTKSEIILWDKLKGKQLGHRFRRQHPIGIYVADFYCHQKKLVIELDGAYHQTKKQKILDQKRTMDLERLGLTVTRFSNEEVLNELERVVEEIKMAMARATPSP